MEIMKKDRQEMLLDLWEKFPCPEPFLLNQQCNDLVGFRFKVLLFFNVYIFSSSFALISHISHTLWLRLSLLMIGDMLVGEASKAFISSVQFTIHLFCYFLIPIFSRPVFQQFSKQNNIPSLQHFLLISHIKVPYKSK